MMTLLEDHQFMAVSRDWLEEVDPGNVAELLIDTDHMTKTFDFIRGQKCLNSGNLS